MGGSVRSMSTTDSSILSMRFVGFNVSIFLTFALGYLLLILVLLFLSPGGGGATGSGAGVSRTGGFLGGSLVALFALAMVLSPLIALVTGLFTGLGTNGTGSAAVTGLVGSGLGFVMLTLLVLGRGGLFLGGGFGGLGSTLPVLLGLVLTTGVTGSVSAAVSSHYQ